MGLTEQEIGSVQRGLDRCLSALPVEPWREGHDWAMRCRDMEEGIADSLPRLDDLLAAWTNLLGTIALGTTLNDDNRHALGRVCRVMSLFREVSLSRLLEIERAGYPVDGADEYREKFKAISATLDPIANILDRPLPRGGDASGDSPGPDAPPVGTESETPALPPPGRRERVAAREVSSRPIDPPFLTGEFSAPFDLPRYGPRRPIALRSVGARLAEPHDLRTPFREHLNQHFAVTYMRIGLPEPYATEP